MEKPPINERKSKENLTQFRKVKRENSDCFLQNKGLYLYCPIDGREINVSLPHCWRVCSNGYSGLHIIFVKSIGKKLFVEVVSE